jgi:Protein of unknown function (DUF3237)
MSVTEIPVQHLFTMTLKDVCADRQDFVGPFGRRIFERPSGGSVDGARVRGQVLNLLATDYGNASVDGSIRHFDANVTAQTDDGVVILMQIRGRASPNYGAGQSRIQILFTVGPGPYDWLNGVQAIGIGRDAGGDAIHEVYALTGAQEGSATVGSAGLARERTRVTAEYLFTRQSQHTPGAQRHIIDSPLGKRYLTLAEGGGAFQGPRLQGQFLPGFSWSPHRIGTQHEQPLLHYDVKTLLRTDDGVPILMSYVGVYSTAYPDQSWVTAILFEVPAGPYAWLNEVQAVGVGRTFGGGTEYKVYALK